ncbi:thioredoxin-disulfide reductase [Oceanotoga sp. DSM 15011]|jgi:thioredoxin reductase (NADPH)|uniref:Thioredoxin reductase n=1 Tax=Oceanotoga teriensis TaxID=515440 RepID=A0AA45C965_9BACT|nr:MULTISPECIES: thioredoxin-disulfide reductase [Oceanotoga]MDN5341626.1 thioredoxin reductase [Oceanotoga sp.]MDO7977171.1 thioredoxin-disulfide reductase [Oceanotoga teriensis]PWJ96558.1 thioredoxin reductase (NADPH) [Oceanotoga teriensis]UYP00268.1 thioredoxin-disulfide reductase [Oceanotoga sp. DSM 15011]
MFFDLGNAGKKDLIKDYYDMIIIGGGPGGISAAIYAVQGGIKPLIIEKTLEGGQMNLTELVENYPGFTSIKGSEISKKMGEHAKHFGVEFHFAQVMDIKLNENEKIIITDDGKTIKTKVLVIASGATPKHLNIKGEEEFNSKGISYCATCDGHFFKNQKVAVIGGGNTAIEEALYLSKIAKEVHVIHRRDKLRADKMLQDRAFNSSNIKFRWNKVVNEFKGDFKLKELELKDTINSELTTEKFDGAFIFIGHKPETSYLKDMLELDDAGYIKTDKNLETSVKGIYAVGDIRDTPLKQIVTAVADGAIVSSHAVRKYFN